MQRVLWEDFGCQTSFRKDAGVSRVFCENLAAGISVLSCASQCYDLFKFTSWGFVSFCLFPTSVTVGFQFLVSVCEKKGPATS